MKAKLVRLLLNAGKLLMSADEETWEEERTRHAEMFRRCKFKTDDDGGGWSKDAHWKREVMAVIEPDELDAMEQAIRYFTGGGLYHIEETHTGRLRVFGRGYYHHIGA